VNPSAPNNIIRVLCIDDHPLILQGVAAVVGTEEGMELVASGTNGEEAVELFRTHRPDVTLIDLMMPGMGGVDAIRKIREIAPDARVIALTTYRGDEDIHRALDAGAMGFLLKDTMRKELTAAIQKVAGGGRFISPVAVHSLVENSSRAGLTPREIEVLNCIANGLRNKEIASRLTLSEDTIKFHIRGILSKLDVNDRTHAVTQALRRGIIHLD
jgi:DNA-binding NarL/FixJ family response regulator